MRIIDILEKKLSFLKIEDLMLHICVISGIVYIMENFLNIPMTALLSMNPTLVLKGQVWRLFSFVIVPPVTTPIFLIITLYFYYMIGSGLEAQWGTTKFNIYYLFSVIGTIIASFITHATMTAFYINISMFLAFAVLYPDFELLLFFILPIKVKYLAYADAFFLVFSFITGSVSTKASILAALIAFIIFFGNDFLTDIKQFIKRENYKRKFK